MWKITKTQEEKEHEKADKEMIAFYKILPLDQKKRANLALIHGRIEALEQTTIIPKQTTKIVESDEVTESTATEKITSATKSKRMSQKQVQKIHENRIGMVQIPNGNWQAKTGDVDGQFTAFAELSEWLVVSPNPKNRKENRIFLNTDDKKLKAKFVTQCKKEGFEVSFN